MPRAAASFNRQALRVAIRHDVADAAHFADAARRAGARRGRRPRLPCFPRRRRFVASMARASLSVPVQDVTVTNGTRASDGKNLHRKLVEEGTRRFDDGKSERFHVEESRRARRAEIAVALALGADDVADRKAGRRIGAADAADDDLARARLRKKERHGVCGVDRLRRPCERSPPTMRSPSSRSRRSAHSNSVATQRRRSTMPDRYSGYIERARRS